jgi:SAM-dependent MidA family methyltransferase
MGSSSTSSTPLPAAFQEAFQRRAAPGNRLTFADFMALALYDEQVGYYRQPRQRVGYAPGTDFFTASTSGPVFGGMIAAACTTLLRGENPADYDFVEIGAETEGGVLTGVPHPFARSRVIRPGDPITLDGQCVVFSNELFDAQPFRRFVRQSDGWRELAVTLEGAELSETSIPLADPPPELPAAAPEGYVIDAPLAAANLLREITAQPWHGLFVACDYGKTWADLCTNHPAGTARSYHRHVQGNALLDHPGEQDLTCHICWDWLEASLRQTGFETVSLESQEAFLVKHAAGFIQDIATAEAARFSERKLAVMQLLHPAHLGQKFQVLHALRR